MERRIAEQLRDLVIKELCNVSNDSFYAGYMCAVGTIERLSMHSNGFWKRVSNEILEEMEKDYKEYHDTEPDSFEDEEFEFDDLLDSLVVDNCQDKITA